MSYDVDPNRCSIDQIDVSDSRLIPVGYLAALFFEAAARRPGSLFRQMTCLVTFGPSQSSTTSCRWIRTTTLSRQSRRSLLATTEMMFPSDSSSQWTHHTTRLSEPPYNRWSSPSS